MDQLAQSLIRVARVDQYDVAVLLVILAHKVVHKERLAASARTEDKLIAVRDHAFLHRQVANVQMQRSARHPVHHLDAEGRERVLVVRFFGEEAQGLRDERVETLLEREVPFVPRYRRPKKGRHVHGIIPRLALHQGELAAHLVLDSSKLLPVIAPCHHVAVATHRCQPFRMCLVQIFLDPGLVYLVGTGVAGERVHVPGGLLEAFQVLRVVINENVLVVHVVTIQQQTHRGGKRQAAVRTIGREPFITAVRTHLTRQILRVREGMQAEEVVADTHLLRVQLDVLQYRRVALREREVLLHDACGPFRPRDFVRRKAVECDEPAVVHDLLELPDGFKELRHRFRVLYLFRDNPALAQRAEGALLTAAHLRRLGKEQVAEMVQEWAFIEVSLERAAKEAQIILVRFRPVLLLDEEVLLMHDGVIRQYLYRLVPSRMDRFVLAPHHGEQLGQFHLEGDCHIRLLAHDAAVFHRQQRKLAFQRCRFHYISHFFQCLKVNNRGNFRRFSTYLGCRFRAAAFISPWVPYLSFRRKVSHTRNVAETAPKPMHTHWFTPAMYRMTNTTNTASRPQQKMKRYWLSSPLNSTFLPIPLLISKSMIRSFTRRRNAG